jgi:translation initiation factor 2A
VDEAVAVADLEKKKKALLKKLKQIDELKGRQAAGEPLNAEQIAKIQTETALREDLAALK